MSEFTLEAQLREDLGKGASRRLRREEKIPAVVYGGKQPAQSLTLDHHKVFHASENEAFYSSILTLNIAGKAEQVVLKDIQRHPYKPKIAHLDFVRVAKDEKLVRAVPLHTKGDEVALGVKEGGIVNRIITQVEVVCYPKDLPEFVEVDISGLGMDESIHLSQLVLPKGVELHVEVSDSAHDAGVVSIHKPKIVEEPVVEEEEIEGEGEGEVAEEGQAAEGEQAEGGENKAADKTGE